MPYGSTQHIPPTSLLLAEIAGVNTASLGGYSYSSEKRARWAEGIHDDGYKQTLKQQLQEKEKETNQSRRTEAVNYQNLSLLTLFCERECLNSMSGLMKGLPI